MSLFYFVYIRRGKLPLYKFPTLYNGATITIDRVERLSLLFYSFVSSCDYPDLFSSSICGNSARRKRTRSYAGRPRYRIYNRKQAGKIKNK